MIREQNCRVNCVRFFYTRMKIKIRRFCWERSNNFHKSWSHIIIHRRKDVKLIIQPDNLIDNHMDIISPVGTHSVETSLHASTSLTIAVGHCITICRSNLDISAYACDRIKEKFVSLCARSLKMMRVVSSNCHFRTYMVHLIRYT